jgi:small subunit ribosomal protein S8
MWSDPIADMLTRIRNAFLTRAREVKIPASNVKFGIAEVLKNEGYIQG